MSLASKLLSIIESSICVPNVLGSIAIVTPVPNIPVEDVPTHECRISKDTIRIVNSCGDAKKDRDILKERLGKN